MGGTEIFFVAVFGAAVVAAFFFGLSNGGGGGGGVSDEAALAGASADFFFATAFLAGSSAFAVLAGLRLNNADSFSFTLLSARLAGALAFLGFSGFITVGFGMTRV